tara:strand:- start:150 stop:407 length:258 start_codon:yes stop_codon:yes gene_type:complete
MTWIDTIKWKREDSGHYKMFAEYIWKEPEIHAEIKKEKGKWKYCLWTWGSASPEPLGYTYETFKTARDIKEYVIGLISGGEPQIR